MPLYGEVFISELVKMPVLDPTGEELGRVKDFIVIKGDPLPRLSALILEKKKKQSRLDWTNVGIFNKRIISSNIYAPEVQPYDPSDDDLLIARDIFDKQIVDANGAKVVRVNDVKLEGMNEHACLVAVDVGIRGILRRMGIERRSEDIYTVFGKTLPHNLIRWGYIQPLEPRLTTISLIVPRQMISDLHPADIAEIISKVPAEKGIALFKSLDPDVAAEALHELEANVKRAIIESLDKDHATDVVERMPPDEAADLMSDLESDKAKELLESIEEDEAQDIQELLAHEEDTAGGLMTNQFIFYPPELTVREAMERLRIDSPDVETVYYIYIVKDEKLLGIASLRDIIISSPDLSLSEIMETKIKTVSPETNQQVVAEIISKYNLLAIPVADADNNLLGIVTIDDIIDIFLPPSSRKKRRRV
ncbi:MAG: magnesium transporter [Nitrospirae bacterium]|nr:magnesium transporter [Nitrospirota bacterium]